MSSERRGIRLWQGVGLLTVQSSEEKPLRVAPGIHALAALEIPFLPEADRPEDTSRVAKRRQLAMGGQAMARMIQGLYLPVVWKGAGWEPDTAVLTFDLRIVSRPGESGPGRLRMFVLTKAFVPTVALDSERDAERVAVEQVVAGVRICQAVAPRDLALLPIVWADAEDSAAMETTAVEPVVASLEDVLLPGQRLYGGELRRENIFRGPVPDDYSDFCSNVGADAAVGTIARWPAADPTLLATCSVMANTDAPTVVSVRLQPTKLTRGEREGLLELHASHGSEACATASDPAREMDIVSALRASSELFMVSAEVASTEPLSLREVLTTYAGEQSVPLTDTDRSPSGGYPAALRCLDARESAIVAFNMRHLDFWPWAALDEVAYSATAPDGSYSDDAPEPAHSPSRDVLVAPDVFQQRDLPRPSRLARIRKVLTLPEAVSLWRLPQVPSGGQAGLSSRMMNPFEQLPLETCHADSCVSLGFVQHRGRSTRQEYKVPLLGHSNGVAGIGDRVNVVAGSPGAGKTNFCINVLQQLWTGEHPSASRVPYLVIDPTRGGEFRSLLASAPKDLIVFTVGDPDGVPFCFNPFVVAPGVSVQAHISRLMSCFRTAYWMWDPLPALFEDAIRRAYRRRFTELGVAWHAAKLKGTGVLEDYPTLADVCDAMGTGRGGESDTTLAREAERWGEGTENQATILASTATRFENLRENFEHIIGGPAEDRECIDIGKLLTKPAVLELGMIGDSQALALITAFLVVSLVGFIETRNRAEHPLHIIVLEEAHRLLSAEGGQSAEGGNSRAQAADDLNTLLAEVRKYGQGVMLLDQRPGSLVGGAIDNAYLVALHRLNEQKSFLQFADALNLSQEQRRYARVGLLPGECIVLDRASGVPLVIRPPEVEKLDQHILDDRELRERFELLRPDVLYPRHNVADEALDPDDQLVAQILGSDGDVGDRLGTLQAMVDAGTPDDELMGLAIGLLKEQGVDRQLRRRLATSLLRGLDAGNRSGRRSDRAGR